MGLRNSSTMQTAPPPVAPPANPTAKAPPGYTHSPPGIVVDPLADLSNRMAALEHGVELILQHLLHQAWNNGTLCAMAPGCIARQTPMFAASPSTPSNLEPIAANWSWEWCSVPALPINESYHRCYYNGKIGHCLPGTAALWYVRWAIKRENRGRYFFMCDSCAKYWRGQGKLDGYQRLI